jgi:hypothetical protein
LRGGLPHSEIPGSTIARISPGLFAACHVLHRLSVPRHPPDALTSRLSATPNGKNHPVIRHGKPLLSEDTYGTRTANPPGFQTTRLRPGGYRLGHTTRFFTIVHQQRAPASRKGPSGGNSSSCRVLGSLRCRRPYGATGRCCFTAKPAVSPVVEAPVPVAEVVEVNGIEPMTSCLQSRRSPS